METDFRAFFLLMETIIEIRRNPMFIKYFCQGKLIPVGEIDFLASENHFFVHFSGTLASDSRKVFFPSSRKVFFNKFLIPASGNGFFVSLKLLEAKF